MRFGGKYVELKNIIVSDVFQVPNDKYLTLPLICRPLSLTVKCVIRETTNIKRNSETRKGP